MNKAAYHESKQSLSKLPNISQFLDDQFIIKQFQGEPKNYILRSLATKQSVARIMGHLPTLERRLIELAPFSGYARLKKRLQAICDWDEYFGFLAQLDITLWFKNKGILRR